MSRPKNDVENEQIRIIVSPEQKARIRAAAAVVGLDMSSYIRMTVLEAATRVLPPNPNPGTGT